MNFILSYRLLLFSTKINKLFLVELDDKSFSVQVKIKIILFRLSIIVWTVNTAHEIENRV